MGTMKKLVVLLPFGLLGGLITFLGGLFGKTEITVLLLRSLSAVVLCPIILLGLLLILSKGLFSGQDIFEKETPLTSGDTLPRKNTKEEPPTRKKSNPPPQSSRAALEAESDSEIDHLIAASNRHGDGGTLSADRLAEKIAKESQISNTAEGQLRNADSKDLAHLVRYSINNEEM